MRGAGTIARAAALGAALLAGAACDTVTTRVFLEPLDVGAGGASVEFGTPAPAGRIVGATFFYHADGMNSLNNQFGICGATGNPATNCAETRRLLWPGCETGNDRCRLDLDPRVFGGSDCPVENLPSVPCGQPGLSTAFLEAIPAGNESGGFDLNDLEVWIVHLR